MELNKVQSQLQGLHRQYTACVASRMEEFLSLTEAQRRQNYKEGSVEFCATEKNAYLSFMEHNAPVQYKNILKLEDANY